MRAIKMPGRAVYRLLSVGLFGVGVFAQASPASADAILDVNNAMLQIISLTSTALVNGPPEAAREIAEVDTAMFDAVNAASGSHYSSYAYTGGPVANASATAAALQAGYATLQNIFLAPSSPYVQYEGVTGATFYSGVPGAAGYSGNLIGPSNTTMAAVASIIGGLGTELSGLGGGLDVINGTNLGTATANAMIANQSTSGATSAILNGLNVYTPPGSGTTPGVYVPPGGRPAMMPGWGAVTPTGMTSTTLNSIVSTVPAPPAINSSAYASNLLQVECEGTATALPSNIASACVSAGFFPETPQQTQAALFWNDPAGTYTPPGHWLQITDTVAASQGLNLLDEARLDALVALAGNDAGIGAWGIKYQDNYWRPVTAIDDCSNWNPDFTTCDPGWSSVIATPPHPDFLAGHPAFSGAAATVLTDFFGAEGNSIPFCSTSQGYINGSAGFVAPITECFTSFTDASNGFLGAEFSRVDGGIHTPFAVQDALLLGNGVGANIFANDLRPVPEPPGVLILFAACASLAGVMAMRGRRGGTL
jgi:hypothetical protein